MTTESRTTSTILFFDQAQPDPMEQGNKGANLVIMTRLGLPVPMGVVIPISTYKEYRRT